MSNEVSNATDAKVISHPRFAAFYNRIMGWPLVRRMFDPLRREIVGQAHGIVLEVGAGGGQTRSLGSSRFHHTYLCPSRVPPIPRCTVRECGGYPRLLFRT
jgi:hypothetical protein